MATWKSPTCGRVLRPHPKNNLGHIGVVQEPDIKNYFFFIPKYLTSMIGEFLVASTNSSSYLNQKNVIIDEYEKQEKVVYHYRLTW